MKTFWGWEVCRRAMKVSIQYGCAETRGNLAQELTPESLQKKERIMKIEWRHDQGVLCFPISLFSAVVVFGGFGIKEVETLSLSSESSSGEDSGQETCQQKLSVSDLPEAINGFKGATWNGAPVLCGGYTMGSE